MMPPVTSAHMPGLLAVDELDLHAVGQDLAGQPLGDGVARHGAIGGPHQVGHGAADELLRRDAEQLGGNAVGEDDALAVDDHGLGHGVGEIGEQRLALADLPVLGLQRVEQPVDGLAETGELRRARGRSRRACRKRPSRRRRATSFCSAARWPACRRSASHRTSDMPASPRQASARDPISQSSVIAATGKVWSRCPALS